MDKHWNDVIGIGSAVYDVLMAVDRFPAEDTKLEGRETRVQGGGPCATALVAAQKLGVSTAYMGTVGGDPFGQFLLEDFARRGVDTRYVKSVPGAVSFHSVVLLNQGAGTRTCIWNRGTVPPPSGEQLDFAALAHAKVLHLDGHMLEAALCAAQLCRQSGAKVSYDAGGTYPGVERLLPLAHWLIPSEEFACKITGEAQAEDAARALYAAYHPELVAITQGARGGILLDASGLRRYESFPVDAKDTARSSRACCRAWGTTRPAAMRARRRPSSARAWARATPCRRTRNAAPFCASAAGTFCSDKAKVGEDIWSEKHWLLCLA